jgi:hypothetical protein
VLNLAKLAADSGFKIALDESANVDASRDARSWYYQIPCRYGHVGVWGKTLLSAYATGRIMIGKLASLPGVNVVQRGDDEIQVTFHPDRLADVANLLHARRRRTVSERERARLRAISPLLSH